MFGVILFRRLRISAAHIEVPLSNSRPIIQFFSSTISSFATSENEEFQKAHSFTVSYLVNSCGLSPKTAIIASRKVRLQNPETPDSVLAFFRDHEFSKTQISKLIKKRPKYLLSDPIENFLPKLEFFYSKGISKKTMARFLSRNSYLLHRSLDSYIVPCFDRLKSVLPSEKQVVTALNNSWLSFDRHWEGVVSNVALLKDLGVSDSSTIYALTNFTVVMMMNPERFEANANKVKEMGFDPKKSDFIDVLRKFSLQSPDIRWRENFTIFEELGWSEADILIAFENHPICMTMSENRIYQGMDYMVNVMGQPAKTIARYPVILFHSLKRIIHPRCSVVRVLVRKGIIEQSDVIVKLSILMQYGENKFLAKYVTKYETRVPLLMSVYEGKVDADKA